MTIIGSFPRRSLRIKVSCVFPFALFVMQIQKDRQNTFSFQQLGYTGKSSNISSTTAVAVLVYMLVSHRC